MTDDRTLSPDAPDPDLIAAELALGLLEGDERATALRRVLAEPAFAREVEQWRTHFAQLFADWPEVTPPAHLLPEIERALDRPAPAVVVRRRLGIWPAMTAAATLVAACLALVIFLRPAAVPPLAPAPSQPGPILVAQLAPAEKGSAAKPIAAVYDLASNSLRIAAAPLAGEGKAAELWMIPADGVPRAMGVLNATAATPMALDAGQRALLSAGVTLAVSIEPPGGSPTGKPTGPVVATGTLSLV